MSWTHELEAMPPGDLPADLAECVAQYLREGVPIAKIPVFVGLRVLQRLSYFIGWSVGRTARACEKAPVAPPEAGIEWLD